MSRRAAHNQLPENLPQLQNLIKRDPESYEEEFQQQLRRFKSVLQALELNPGERSEDIEELSNFLAQVWSRYSESYDLGGTLGEILKRHSGTLDPETRMNLVKSCGLLGRKGSIPLKDLVSLYFYLLKCPDKGLRMYLKERILSDVKSFPVSSEIQTFIYSMLRDSHPKGAKAALDVMIGLYNNGAWKDSKTVNVISNACFSDVVRVSATAVKFFLGTDTDDEDEDDDDEDNIPTVKEVAHANKFNKKTKKRLKMINNIKKIREKKKKKQKSESFNFSALHLLHDPQTFAEKLFKKLESLKEKFEIKLLFLDLISRLIGTHELFILNYYTYIARFLNPHQREVVQMLQFAAQAAHELVPSDAIEPVLKALANNFITERNSAEVMAVGLNAVRELCKRCPLAIDETLLRDFAMYKSYKDKGVMMAARSLISLYRANNPELLLKKDRGRPTEAVAELSRKNYGELDVKDFIPGAEALEVDKSEDEGVVDDDSGEWENISNCESEVEEENDVLTLEEKRKKAAQVTESRILTDADFRRIDSEQIKKHVTAYRKGGKKRKFEETEASDITSKGREELVDLAKIEMVYKKRKHDKATRMESVAKGREGREKFGSVKGKLNENTGTSNKIKNKKKNFSMLKHKLKFKAKRSFSDRQRDLRKSLLKSQKFK